MGKTIVLADVTKGKSHLCIEWPLFGKANECNRNIKQNNWFISHNNPGNKVLFSAYWLKIKSEAVRNVFKKCVHTLNFHRDQ